MFSSRQRPFKHNITRLNVDGFETFHLPWNSLFGGEAVRDRQRPPQYAGFRATSNGNSKRVITMGFQVGNGYGIVEGEILYQNVVGSQILDFESVEFTLR